MPLFSNRLNTLIPLNNNANTVIGGDVEMIESSGCLVRMSKGEKVVIQGLKDCIVPENNDFLLI